MPPTVSVVGLLGNISILTWKFTTSGSQLQLILFPEMVTDGTSIPYTDRWPSQAK